MKKNTHPTYQDILFIDSSTGHKFVCGAAMAPSEKETFNGKEYPVCRVAISSASHPLFTGSSRHVDAEGRVDKFKRRYATAAQKKQASEEDEDASQDKKGKKKSS